MNKNNSGETFFLRKDGKPLVNQDGYAGISEFLTYLRGEKPSFFNAPTGSGAVGNRTPGGAHKPGAITRAEFDALSAEKRISTVKAGVQITD